MWCTSHQFFRDILVRHGPLSSLSAKVFDFAIAADQPILSVQILRDSCVNVTLPAKFVRPQSKKKSCSLPFGLTMPRRKRTRTKRDSTSVPASAPSSAPSKKRRGVERDIEDALDAAVSDIQEEEPSQSSSESDSDISMSVADVSSESSDTEGGPLAMDPQQRMEENATRQVLRSHAELIANQEEPTGALPSSSSARRPSTQCQSSIGLCDVGKQVAAKLAKCRHCGQSISRGSTRLAYSFSKVKFFGWIHIGCFAAYLRDVAGNSGQCIAFITSWLQNHPECSMETKAELESLMSTLAAN